MTNLITELTKDGLTSSEIEKVLLTIEGWLNNKYPILGQLYRTEFLKDIKPHQYETNYTGNAKQAA